MTSTLDVVDPLWQRTLNDRFTILEPIGSGGMGKVYRAVQAPLGRVVALKVLDPKYANGKDPEFRKRFFLEASLTARLRHPNTITVIDYGQTRDGIFYLVMEYLEGQTLAQHLVRSGPLPWMRCLNIAQQVCRSLREAHKLGVVHRDLKPANVMLLSEDQEMDLVKVLDFGLVKSLVAEPNGRASEGDAELPDRASEDTLAEPANPEVTLGGMFVGSPQYMAPEQARNRADHRSDIYALGATVYHMMVGRPPFLGKDSVEIIFKHINEPPPAMRSLRQDLEIPPETEAVFMKCLEKQPAARFQSMDEVLEAIRRAAMMSGSSGFFASAGSPLPNGIAVTPPPMPTFEGPSPEAPPPLPVAPQAVVEAGTENGALKETTLALDISVVPSVVAPPPARAPVRRPPIQAFPQPWMYVAGGATLLGLILILVVSLGKGGSKPSETPKPPPRAAEPPKVEEKTVAIAKPVVPTPPPQSEVAPIQGPKMVKFRVASDPLGATVSMGGQALGVTPLTFEVPGNAQGTATARLVFSLRGYQSIAVVTGGSGEIVLSEKLQLRPRSGGGSSERAEIPEERPATVVAATETRPEPASRAGLAPADARPPPEPETKVASITPSPPGDAPAAVGAPSSAVVPAAAIVDRPAAPVAGGGNFPQGPVEFDEKTMTAPAKVSGPDPQYTQRAVDREVEGQMVVRCIVTTHGTVNSCRVLKGLPFMDRSVVDALEKRIYRPAILQGRPVEVYYTFRLTLTLPR